MKLTKAILREHGIINPYDLCKAGRDKVAVVYRHQELGRMNQPARWQVMGVGFQVDPDGPWYNYGAKTFIVGSHRNETHAQSKERQRQAAIAWATERYGITEWERDPFGDFQAKATMDRVRELCK